MNKISNAEKIVYNSQKNINCKYKQIIKLIADIDKIYKRAIMIA